LLHLDAHAQLFIGQPLGFGRLDERPRVDAEIDIAAGEAGQVERLEDLLLLRERGPGAIITSIARIKHATHSF
jgi:hypothetical protein